jgi:hypothetical protein
VSRTGSLARVPLGSVGREHVIGHLQPFESSESEGYPLRRALAGLVRNGGVVWTWAPAGWRPTLEQVRDASLPERITQRHHRDLLFAFIRSYLKTTTHLMVIEDHDSSPRDRFLLEEPRLPQWVSHRNHVYWYATPNDLRTLWKVLNWGMGLYTSMALADGPALWTPTQRFTQRSIDRIADTAEHVVIDAFDFEGTVVWSRQAAGLRLSRTAR